MVVLNMGRMKTTLRRDKNNKNDIKEKTNKLEKASKRKLTRPTTNAARERSRVQNLKSAFLELQDVLPNVPDGTKLSKLDVLLLATNYISHLMSKLYDSHVEHHLNRLQRQEVLHPIKKWPMRSRLYLSCHSTDHEGSSMNQSQPCDRSSVSSSSSDSLTSDQSASIFDSSDSSENRQAICTTTAPDQLTNNNNEICDGSPVWSDVFSDTSSSVD